MNNKVIVNDVDVIELIERDTPKKVIIDAFNEGHCPVCNGCTLKRHVHKDKNFCNNCGQRLDWS